MQTRTRLGLLPINNHSIINPEPLFRIDKSALEKVLAINPALAQGRTLDELKGHFEAGGGIPQTVRTPPGYSTFLADELEASFFNCLQTQLGIFRAEYRKIQQEKAAIEKREQELKQQSRTRLASFLSLMDLQAVQAYGKPILEKFSRHLAQLETNPSELLNRVLSNRS